MKDFVKNNLVPVIAWSLGLIVAAGIFGAGAYWVNSTSVSPVSARVLNVGGPHTTTYQCGSNKVGDVSIPVFCTQTTYDTTFVVVGSDIKFSESVTSQYSVGFEKPAYKIIDGGEISYSLFSPKDPMLLVIFAFFSILGGAIVGFIGYAVAEHFLDY